eukprot:14675-Heterococcus_DN1.PRE.1
MYSYIRSRFYRSPEVLLGLPYVMVLLTCGAQAASVWRCSLGCLSCWRQQPQSGDSYTSSVTLVSLIVVVTPTAAAVLTVRVNGIGFAATIHHLISRTVVKTAKTD